MTDKTLKIRTPILPRLTTALCLRAAAASLFFTLGSLAPAAVQAQSEDWARVNATVTEQHILPAYDHFAQAGSALADTATSFCAQVDERSVASFQSAWHDAMDAWQGVQHIRFGPITYFNWQYRLQFWPDDRGIGSRQLTALIAAQDDAALTPDAFGNQSVGVQGLPALESLLFSEDAVSELQDGYRCTLAQAIGRNIGDIAMGVDQRWREEFSLTMRMEDDSTWFEDEQDVTTELLKALIETLPLLSEQKLALPLGDAREAARPRRAESWRSERSLRNIRTNVAALSALAASPLAEVLPASRQAEIAAGFSALENRLAALPDALTPLLANAEGYAELQALQAEINALYETLEAAVKETDLYLGFNSLDGD